MAPARVVETFEIIEHGHAGLGLRAEATTVEQLALERAEKALAHRVVVRVTELRGREHALRDRAELRTAGMSLRSIAATLDESGLRARSGRPFAAAQVARMLSAA